MIFPLSIIAQKSKPLWTEPFCKICQDFGIKGQGAIKSRKHRQSIIFFTKPTSCKIFSKNELLILSTLKIRKACYNFLNSELAICSLKKEVDTKSYYYLQPLHKILRRIAFTKRKGTTYLFKNSLLRNNSLWFLARKWVL